jgi:hypothetical protein
MQIVSLQFLDGEQSLLYVYTKTGVQRSFLLKGARLSIRHRWLPPLLRC